MRILHTADLHLEIASHGQVDPDRGISTRLIDQEMTLQWIYETAVAEKVSAVVIAGDVTHQKVLRGAALDMFVRFLRKCSEAGLQVVACDGNHDVEGAGQAASTVSALDRVHGARCVSRPEIITLDHMANSRTFETVDLLVIPFPNRAVMQAAGVAYGDAGGMISSILLDMMTKSKAETKIVVSHITVAGSQYNPDAQPNIMSPSDLTVAAPVLVPEGVKMALMGHIHGRQKIGKCFYSGAPLAFDFGDGEDDRGVTVVDTEANTLKHHVNPHNRKFVTLGDGAPDATPPTGSFVRYKAKRVLSNEEKAAVRAKCDSLGATFCGFIEQVEREVRKEAQAVVKATTPDDVIRAYCKAIGGDAEAHAEEIVLVSHGEEVSGL